MPTANSDTPDPQLNQIVRAQLRDLQIDPDSVSAPGPRASRRWFASHRSALGAIVVCGMALLALIITSIVALYSQPQYAMGYGATPGPIVVTFDDSVVKLSTSAIRGLSSGNVALELVLNVSNRRTARAVLLAGDMALVDAQGAVVGPSWQAADGTWHEGLSEPAHALVGLEPSSQTALRLTFVIDTPGPFSLRYTATTAWPVSVALS